MAEQFLDVANVHAVIEAMRCTTVTKHMRVNSRDAGAPRAVHYNAEYLTGREPSLWIVLTPYRHRFDVLRCEKCRKNLSRSLSGRYLVIAKTATLRDALPGCIRDSPLSPPHTVAAARYAAALHRQDVRIKLTKQTATYALPNALPERFGSGTPKNGDTVIPAFALADNQAPGSEVHVLDAKVRQFAYTQHDDEGSLVLLIRLDSIPTIDRYK